MKQLLLLIFIASSVNSYNFLVFCPLAGHSHTTFFARIADTLTEAGHFVTFFTPTIIPHFEKIDYVKSTKHVVKLTVSKELKEFSGFLKSPDMTKFWTEDSTLFEILPVFCTGQKKATKNLQTVKVVQKMRQLQSERMFEKIEVLNELKRNYKYDAIIYETFHFQAYPLMDYLNITTQIPATPATHDTEMARAMGETIMPSSVVELFSPFDDRMTFFQRVYNCLVTPIFYAYIGTPYFLSFTQPRKPIDIMSRRSKSAFILTNSNPYIDFPRPTITKTVQIGGITVDKNEMRKDTLNKEIDDILNVRSENILISFGSVQQSQFMPDSYKLAIIETFSKFPNVTFIWKYESDNFTYFSRNLPNVHFMKWVPQRAMLVDLRVTAFITHAGLGSVNELGYSGKPAILCPIFADQMRNAKMLARHGGAIEYSKFDLDNSLKFEKAIQKLLYDSKYREKAENLARRLEKQPIKPADLLVKHCEFAAEFGELPSLDPYSRQMPFFTYFMIDIALIFLSSLIVLLVFSYWIFEKVCVRVFYRKTLKNE